jgi:protein-disulfide isomerase
MPEHQDHTTPTLLRPEDHVLGQATAPILLIEFGDFQCPTCKQAAPVVDMLLKEHELQIRFAFRHYPLEDLHPEAMLAAEAAESAAAQGRFWDMHAILFAHQQHLQSADLEGYAAEIGLDVTRFRADMREHVHLARVRADLALGQQLHVRSTPGFFINGKFQDVSFGMRSLHDAVQSLLA